MTPFYDSQHNESKEDKIQTECLIKTTFIWEDEEEKLRWIKEYGGNEKLLWAWDYLP